MKKLFSLLLFIHISVFGQITITEINTSASLNPKIGFTVGLGFAMLENLQYIALSWTGGPLSFTLTSLIRAIGSIPGHAFWTGLTGIGFAYLISKNNKNQKRFQDKKNNEINNWQLIDSKTNKIIETTIQEKNETRIIGEEGNIIFQKFEEDKNKTSKLPKNILICLLFAIIGHSFWNGSSYAVDYYSTKVTSNIIFSTSISLIWITILITSLLILGKLILKNVILLPDKMV